MHKVYEYHYRWENKSEGLNSTFEDTRTEVLLQIITGRWSALGTKQRSDVGTYDSNFKESYVAGRSSADGPQNIAAQCVYEFQSPTWKLSSWTLFFF